MYLICRNSRGNSTRHKMHPWKCWNGSKFLTNERRSECFKSKYIPSFMENMGSLVLQGLKESPPWAICSLQVENCGCGSGVCCPRSEDLRKVAQTSISLNIRMKMLEAPCLPQSTGYKKENMGISPVNRNKELSVSFFSLFFFHLLKILLKSFFHSLHARVLLHNRNLFSEGCVCKHAGYSPADHMGNP